jgi:hypothetical protein
MRPNPASFVPGNIRRNIDPREWSRGAQVGAIAGGFVGGLILAPVLGLGTFGAIALGMAVGATAGVTLEKRYLKYNANIKLGIDPPPITIQRKIEKIGSEERNVFTFENVTAFDFQDIQTAADNFINATQETKEGSALRKIENYNFEERPKYSVRLVAKKDITLAELDYTDMSNFDVVVTNEATHQSASEEESQKVLATLSVMPKFLGNELTEPEAKVSEVMDEAGSVFGDWVKRQFGRTNRITVNPNAPPNPKLEQEEFVDSLINVAVATGRYKEILGHYRNTLVSQYTKANEVKKIEHKVWGHIDGSFGVLTQPIWPQFGMGALATTILVAATFVPRLNIAIVILSAVAAAAFTIFKGFQLVNKLLADRKFKREVEASEKKIESFKNTFKGLDETNQAIEKCIAEKNNNLALESQKASDICAQVISKWICSPAGQTCVELKLPGNNITSAGAEKLAEALDSSYVQKIDLSGNPIGVKGVEAIGNILLSSFAITSFLYDKNDVTSKLRENIEQQLLINNYLQGNTINRSDAEKLFGGDAGLQKAAIEKVKTAEYYFSLSAIDEIAIRKLPQEVQRAIIQTQLQLILTSKVSETSRLEAYISIYERITEEDFKQIEEKQKIIFKSITDALFDKKGKELKLRSASAPAIEAIQQMPELQRTDLIERSIAGNPINGDHAHGIAVLTSKLIASKYTFTDQVLRKCMEQWGSGTLGFNDYISELKSVAKNKHLSAELREEIKVAIQSGLQADLPTRFACLKGSSIDDFPKLQETLQESYELSRFEFLHDVNIEVKAYVENIIRRNQIRDILAHNPLMLGGFFEFYKNMDPKFLVAPAIDMNKLAVLVQADIYNKTDKSMCVGLKKLDEQQRVALLEKCFSSQEKNMIDAANKAILVANLIQGGLDFDKATYRDKGDIEHYIYYAATGSYHYADLKTKLADRRKQFKQAGNYNEAERFDQALQADLRATLAAKFPFLRSPFGEPTKTQLIALKGELSTIPPDLRSEFPGINNQDVADLIAHIVNRNRLNDELHDLERFLAVYGTITQDTERKKCLEGFKKLASSNEAALKVLVQNDVDKPYDFKNLKILNETQRTEILEACLGDDPHAHGIAALVSKLIETATPTGPVAPDYVWRVFDWTARGKWDFKEYIKQLKILRDTSPSVADNINEIIQTGIQKDLIARFNCLKDSPSDESSFADLKNELKQQYDLIKIAERPANPGLGKVRTYIESICHRNSALQAIAKQPRSLNDLGTFISEYRAIDTSCCKEVLSSLDNKQKLLLLETIKAELGESKKTSYSISADNRDAFTTILTCSGLMELDEPHRRELLTQCFGADPKETNAEDKAILVSTMLNALFKNQAINYQTNKDLLLLKNIAYEIFWAISPDGNSGKPYHNFSQLQIRLKEIEAKIDAGAYSDTPSEVQKAIKENLTAAFALKPNINIEPSMSLEENALEEKTNNAKQFEPLIKEIEN